MADFWENIMENIPFDDDIPVFIVTITSIQIVFFILQKIAYYKEITCMRLGQFLDSLTGNSKKMREGQIWRCVTHVLLHGSFMHLFMNMLMQVWIGWILEKQFFENSTQIAFFAGLYFASALGGDFLSAFFKVLMKSEAVGLGASGAVFGLEAIWFVWQLSVYGWSILMVIYGVYSVIMIGLSFVTQDGVDHWAHIGGIISALLWLGASNFLKTMNEATLDWTTYLIIASAYHAVIILTVFIYPAMCRKSNVARHEDIVQLEAMGVPRAVAMDLLKTHETAEQAAATYFRSP